MTQPANTSSLPPKRVLVVDDEPSVGNTILIVLKMDGYQIQVAEDAEQALALYESDKPDLVITDFKLPGMDGLEMARVLRQRCPSQRIILITAYLETLEQAASNISNVDLLLGKPFSVQQLRDAVAGLLAG